jgi:hypothetical protein
MAKHLPIKSDLFRFVTFRGPEHVSPATRGLRFVSHPNISKSLIQNCEAKEGKELSAAQYEAFTKRFPSFIHLEAVRKYVPDLADLSTTLYKGKPTIQALTASIKQQGPKLTEAQEFHLFEALIGEIITRKSKEIRHRIAQILIVNHALKNQGALARAGIMNLTQIKIEVPVEVMGCFKPSLYKRCGGSLEGVQNLGVADFRKVEQEVCCYVPGEVSHIENIMAREYKERNTRNFTRTEDTLETFRETEIEKLTDVTTATRNEIASEISNVIEQDKSSNYGGSLGVSANWGTATINVNAYADFATSNSSAYANAEAKTYAEEITKRALERIVQRTSTRRTSKVIKEFEETNAHGFDNRTGDQHVTGVYRWLDIVYTNRLVNYGKRLMVEMMVPEPSEFYKRVLNYKGKGVNPESDPGLEPPKELSSFGIHKPENLSVQLAQTAGSYYGVQIANLPPNETTISKDLSPTAPVDHNRNINTQSLSPILVPSDYEADTANGSYTYEYRANSGSSSQQAFCDFTFGGIVVYSGKDYSGTKKTKTVNININFNPNLGGNIPISVGYSGCFGFYGAVSFKCVLKASVIKDWQTTHYNLLLAAYNSKLEEYNQALAEAESEETVDDPSDQRASNPAMHRIIEQRELKRICIEMLMKPYCRTQGQNNLLDHNACDQYQIPQVNQSQAFTAYATSVKFFEQAIDWPLMSYLFYPYYWADKCDWADLMQRESEDPVFQAFLQSGMARVVVPIRTQYAEAFAFYLETGEIWHGNDLVPGTENDFYLSILEELQTTEGIVEEEWETRVPSTLAIIQGKSAFLEDEGLPCCHGVENNETTSGIRSSSEILQLLKP